jgi:surfactin synthase thioesterase subunit
MTAIINTDPPTPTSAASPAARPAGTVSDAIGPDSGARASTDPDDWFPYETTPGKRVLYWLPHSGGCAVRAAVWIGQLGTDIAVCPVELPGRGTRRGEAAYTSMAPLVADLATAILAHRNGRPWAIGGHALGALTAFETTHAIRARGGGEPTVLIVSGCSAPQEINAADPPLSSLSDEALASYLSTLGGTPAHMLDRREARHLLDNFRADAVIGDQWRYQQYSPLLGMRITAFAAEQDLRVSEWSVRLWQAQTTNEVFDLHRMPGGHFAALEAQATCALLREALS